LSVPFFFFRPRLSLVDATRVALRNFLDRDFFIPRKPFCLLTLLLADGPLPSSFIATRKFILPDYVSFRFVRNHLVFFLYPLNQEFSHSVRLRCFVGPLFFPADFHAGSHCSGGPFPPSSRLSSLFGFRLSFFFSALPTNPSHPPRLSVSKVKSMRAWRRPFPFFFPDVFLRVASGIFPCKLSFLRSVNSCSICGFLLC